MTRRAFIHMLPAKRPRKFGPTAEWTGSRDKTHRGKTEALLRSLLSPPVFLCLVSKFKGDNCCLQ